MLYSERLTVRGHEASLAIACPGAPPGPKGLPRVRMSPKGDSRVRCTSKISHSGAVLDGIVHTYITILQRLFHGLILKTFSIETMHTSYARRFPVPHDLVERNCIESRHQYYFS